MFQITISAETAEEFVGKVSDLAAQFEVEAKPAPAPRAARKPRSKAAEEVAEKDQAPETEATAPEPEQAAKAPEPADIESLRKWVISDYLNKHLGTPQDRAEAFKAICVKFGLAKFGDMTDEQAPQVKAHVQQLIEAAQASK